MSQQIKVLTVTDLHRDKSLYEQLAVAVEQHRPDVLAFVGDFLHAQRSGEIRFTTVDAGKFVSRFQVPEIIFIRGNHEDSALWEFADAWKETGREFQLIDKQAFVYGPLVIIGFPCLLGVLGEPDDSKAELWLPPLTRPFGAAGRTLWLMHEPVYGTVLSQADGVLAGNIEWTLMVERYSPSLVVFGHDHDTPRKKKVWLDRLSCGTVCLNLGQDSTLHYSLLQFTFEENRPSVPSAIKVTAYPMRETVNIKPKGPTAR